MTAPVPVPAGLIERLEKATVGDRALDRDVWRALGRQVIPITERGGHTYERWIDDEGMLIRLTPNDTSGRKTAR